MNKKLILYELNEVPKKVIDIFVKFNKHSALGKILNESSYFDTFTIDEGELHPWSTWPTFHRGVSNNIHGIKYINQDLQYSSKFPPLWEILVENDLKVGVFGSLQSFPPIKHKNMQFYLPDTFAPNEEAFPEDLKEFQKFNLLMTNKNKAISRNIDLQSIRSFMRFLSKNKITLKSYLKISSHLLKENYEPKYKKRRSLLQPIIGFDLYFKLLKKYQPNFTTFFTNHVAGMMHRYWRDLFPEDFGLDLSDVDSFHKNSIFESMKIADKQIQCLKDFADKNNYSFCIASSMGQESIKRGKYIPELFINDFRLVSKALKIDPYSYEILPAMQPDICIKCKTYEALELLRMQLPNIIDTSKNQIFIERYNPVGLYLNLSIKRSKTCSQNKKIQILEKIYDLTELGFELIARDQGTGYHVPEGILIMYGDIAKKYNNLTQRSFDSRKFAPLILDYFDLT